MGQAIAIQQLVMFNTYIYKTIYMENNRLSVCCVYFLVSNLVLIVVYVMFLQNIIKVQGVRQHCQKTRQRSSPVIPRIIMIMNFHSGIAICLTAMFSLPLVDLSNTQEQQRMFFLLHLNGLINHIIYTFMQC